MKELNVRYVGNDTEYWRDIQKAFKGFSNISPSFRRDPVGEDFHPPSSFVDIHNSSCDIIYVDFSLESAKILSLCKLLCRNNVTRLKSVVGLHDVSQGASSLLQGALAGVRLNYYKGIEVEDVVFHPLSLLNSDVAPQMEYARGTAFEKMIYGQILRIGYIADDHYRVETNSPLRAEEIIELESHPLEDVMSANRFFVQNYSDSDLYYNQRFSYNLKYTYVKSGFFQASEKAWVTYKKLGLKRSKLSLSEKKELEYAASDIERRKKELAPVRSKVQSWLGHNQSVQAPKRLKVLVIDETLKIFKEYDGNLDNFNYTINFQTKLTKDFYQIRRSRPHLIVFHYEETGNNRNVLSRVVEQIKTFDNYEPVILVFNCHDNSSVLQSLNEYEHILSIEKGEVHLETIKKMSGLLDDRFHITDPEGKVFLKTYDPRSVSIVEKEAKILSMNESELYFECREKIPMWTTFLLKEPLQAFITVLPEGEHSPKLHSPKKIYRALINGVGEKEKAKLRRLVNTSLG